MAIRGIFHRPFINLEPHLRLDELDEVHEEVCLALAQIAVEYTGGSHRSMNIVHPSRRGECLADYGEAIAAMTPEQFRTFRALSDDPRAIDEAKRDEHEFGEERAIPLSRKQMLWLKVRFGVYFPWKVYVELIPNRYWGDKSRGDAKAFTRQARAFFPKTIAFVESLPFEAIGRCNVMGLEAHDYGTVHRDGEPDDPSAPCHFIALSPARNKRLFLWDEEAKEKVVADSRAYWFNDHDFHGVEAAPFFRYSIRIDGVFRPEFIAMLEREYGR